MLESGIIRYGDAFMEDMEKGLWPVEKVNEEDLKESKATFVFGQMNEPPGARARVALSGLTIAEYFRDGAGDGQGKDVLFFVDNIDRKSTRLNSSHVRISYAVFCLIKKKTSR